MRPLAAAAAFAAAALASGAAMSARAREFPSLSELPATPFTLQDASLASFGLRAAAADLAWVQMLQYVGASLPGLPADRPGRPYDHLLTLALRVARLDPSFHRSYLYAAGILGWFRGVDRPEEAVALLQEGIRRDPGEPLYALYLAALAYKQKGETDRMIALLESAFEDPRTPSQMKTILANARKARGEYAQALALWERILETPRDQAQHARARLPIAQLKRLMHPASPLPSPPR